MTPDTDRGGFSLLFFVSGALAVVLALAASFHDRSLDTSRLARRAHARDVSAHLAEAARAAVLAALRQDVADPARSRFLALVTGRDSARLSRAAVALPDGWDRELKRLAREGGATVTAEVVLVDVRGLDGASPANGRDPAEKRGVIETTARVDVRGVALTYVFDTPFKVVNLIPPVTSKFTLFVRRPERTDERNAGYNTLKTMDDGSPVPGAADGGPLVLDNAGGSDLRKLEGRGFVFLGGTVPVRLQLTSGTDSRAGESFHFQSLTETDDLPVEGIDARSDELLGRHASGSNRFLLKRRFQGFFARDGAGLSMNGGNRLKRYFESGRTTSSSRLHLYGSRQQRSPTVVVGPVYRSFALLSRLVARTGDDDATDTLIAELPGLAWHDYPWQVPSLPDTVQSEATGAAVDVSPLKSSSTAEHDFRHLFGDHGSYEEVMSRIVDDEPYNRSFDFAAGHERGRLTATRALGADSYPASGKAHSLTLDGGEVHFRGDLNALGTTALESRVIDTVPDSAGFLSRYVRDGRLRLGTVVRVEKGDLTLPPRLQVDEGGVILVEGGIVSNGVRNRSDDPLTLCSLKGDIELDTSCREHEFAAIALSGALRNGGQDPIVVRGAVAVDTLGAADLKNGGELTYDPRLDPTAPGYRRYYRAFIGDADVAWTLPQ